MEKHLTLLAAEEAARKSLVVDDESKQQRIDLSPITYMLSPGSPTHDTFAEVGTFHPGKQTNGLSQDQAEQKRLDLQHQIFLTTFDGRLNFAPLDKGVENVLDVGTGTGIWAVDFAQHHPSVQVLGFGMSTYKHTYLPTNCTLEIHDGDSPWSFRQKFDYIHGRDLIPLFISPSLIIQQSFANLTPGSYLELQDVVLPMRSVDSSYSGSWIEKWQDLIVEGASRKGRDATVAMEYKSFMQEAGFVDVTEKHFQWPLGPWAKERRLKAVGVLFREKMLDMLEEFSWNLLADGLGMPEVEVRTLLNEVRRELRKGKVHAYMPVVVVYGRRPV